jgi:hypothetical protein
MDVQFDKVIQEQAKRDGEVKKNDSIKISSQLVPSVLQIASLTA